MATINEKANDVKENRQSKIVFFPSTSSSTTLIRKINDTGDDNDNVVDVKDLRNVRDVEHAYVRFRIRQFFHFNIR